MHFIVLIHFVKQKRLNSDHLLDWVIRVVSKVGGT